MAIGGRRGVGDYGVMIQTGAQLIFAKHVKYGNGMGSRLNVTHIEFIELLDVVKDLIELTLKKGGFFIG